MGREHSCEAQSGATNTCQLVHAQACKFPASPPTDRMASSQLFQKCGFPGPSQTCSVIKICTSIRTPVPWHLAHWALESLEWMTFDLLPMEPFSQHGVFVLFLKTTQSHLEVRIHTEKKSRRTLAKAVSGYELIRNLVFFNIVQPCMDLFACITNWPALLL